MRRLARIALLAAAATTPAAAQQPSEIAIGPAGRELRGTLLRPATPAPAAEPVLILAGSGPTDRDGNNPAGITAQPYRLLAEALAGRGIASLRVDKRGIAGSGAAGRPETELRVGHFADDAHSWAAELRRRTGARCVWLLGHSEGTLHALLAAQQPRNLCGLILVSTVGRKLGDIIRQQLDSPGNVSVRDEARRILAELEAGRSVPAEGMNPALAPLFRPSVQPFVMSMLAADPPALARAYPGPILVVQGTTDLQTRPADAEAIGAARPGIAVRIVEGMNHVLKTAPADPAANAATYSNSSLPLAPGLVETVAEFIEAN
jgi:pimeloyl-ACP methyl ester carboxylesterase